ncbi:hypothetical protein ACFVZC_17285 [Streptomyces marokkonensis]|uniref:Uncharacterized protein n=1 Tax=Streptomyces marokkonensis TaxID=324855 RepID=A0ABW6Q7W4_9ACTN
MTIRLHVAFGRQFVFAGELHSSGEALDVPEATALALLKSGLVLPADGDWRGVTPGNQHTE